MAESLQNGEQPLSPREHPLWKRKERVAKFHSGLAVFFLSAALAVPAASDLAEKTYGSEEDGKPVAAETVNLVAVSSGFSEISSKDNEKEPIRDIAAVLSIVTIPILGMLYSNLCTWRRDQKKRQRFTKEQIESDRYELLPDEHPLKVRVAEYGRMTGINVSRVYLDPVPQYRNANVYRDGKGGAVICFRGTPLLLPGGEAILKGVTAHELAHVKRDSFTGIYLLRAVGALYGIMAAASAGMVMGGIREGFFSVLLKGSLGVLAALPALSRWQSRNEEALTDIEGAEMIGDPQSVIANEAYLQSHKSGGDDWSPSEIDANNLRSLFMRIFGSTHPVDSERIENLCSVYNIHNNKTSIPALNTVSAHKLQDFQA